MATKKTTKASKPSVRSKRTARKKAVPKVPEDGAIDTAAEFEQLLKQKAVDGQKYVLKLYVTGSSLRSGQAIASIRSLCEEYLKDRYDLQVIDIYQQPDEARTEQIIAAPTLVKELPTPPRRMVGDLLDRDRVLLGLNLHPANQEPPETLEPKWLKL